MILNIYINMQNGKFFSKAPISGNPCLFFQKYGKVEITVEKNSLLIGYRTLSRKASGKNTFRIAEIMGDEKHNRDIYIKVLQKTSLLDTIPTFT